MGGGGCEVEGRGAKLVVGNAGPGEAGADSLVGPQFLAKEGNGCGGARGQAVKQELKMTAAGMQPGDSEAAQPKALAGDAQITGQRQVIPAPMTLPVTAAMVGTGRPASTPNSW